VIFWTLNHEMLIGTYAPLNGVISTLGDSEIFNDTQHRTSLWQLSFLLINYYEAKYCSSARLCEGLSRVTNTERGSKVNHLRQKRGAQLYFFSVNFYARVTTDDVCPWPAGTTSRLVNMGPCGFRYQVAQEL